MDVLDVNWKAVTATEKRLPLFFKKYRALKTSGIQVHYNFFRMHHD